MGCCRKCCSCCGFVILIIVVLIGLFAFPPTGDILNVATHKQTDNFGLFMAGFMFNVFGMMTKCMPAMADGGKNALMSCIKNSGTASYAKLYTWHPGFAISVQENKELGPAAFGHEAYRRICYDTKMGRSPTHLSKMNIFTGVMDEDMDKLLVNFATGDPEWVKRRSLIMDNFASVFAEHGSFENIVVPQGMMSVPGYPSENQVRDFVGLNLFRQIFGVDVTTELPDMFDYGEMMNTALAAGGGDKTPPGSTTKMASTRAALFGKAKVSAAAKKFMEAADKIGLNGETRLRDLIWIIMFAGYGGTGYLIIETLTAIRHNPVEMLKLYRKDPDAFILEAARMFPAVAGMNPAVLTSDLSVKTVDGKQKVFPPGTWVTTISSGANRDPNVFKDPEKFDPTRENLERILTWNNEVGDMRKCNSTAGFPACESAPRPCPGTFLAIRVAKAALDFFVPGVEEMIGKKVEL